MFTNFNDAFKGKPLSERKVSDVMLNYLSKDLPEGVRYISDDHGNLIVASENKSIQIGGFRLIVSDEIKKALGSNCTKNTIMQYAYNAQKEIAMELERDGFIKINGEEVAIEKIHNNFFRPVKYTDYKWYVKPQDFPPPFTVTVSSDEYTRKLCVSRVPYESLYVYAFESEQEAPLKIKFYINIEEKTMQMAMSFDLKYATTVKDMVESIFIYNAFVDGKGKFLDSAITVPPLNSEKNLMNKVLNFGERCC